MKSIDVKTLTKRKLVCYGVIVALLVGAYCSRGLIAKRTLQFKDCVAAKYDLRRETNFRFLTGACTAIGKDGSQVYVSQLRTFGTNTHHDVDSDHDHGN